MFGRMDLQNENWVFVTVWTVIVVYLIYKLITWCLTYRRMADIYNKLPGKEEYHWFWGHVHEHPGPGEDGIEFQMGECIKYPYFHKVWFGKIRCVVVCHHPDIVKQILSTQASLAPKPRGPGSSYEIGLRWLGEGLLMANGQRWARNRKLLTPAFHHDILQPYLRTINQCTDTFLDKIDNYAASKSHFDVFQLVCLCSLDIITKCAFSYNSNCQTQGDKNPYVQAVLRLQHLWIRRSLNPLLIFDWFYFNFTPNGREFTRHCRFVHNVAEDIIKQRKITLEREGLPDQGYDGSKKQCLDFLDIILTAQDEKGLGLSDMEIRDEVDTFLFEGHDTTTSAASFILLCLAQHPDIQETCRQEVDSILGHRDWVEWGDLGKFQYLTQCIKEGLRLYSPVFFILRQNAEPFKIDNYYIPAWTHLAINIYNLHHNPVVWGEDAEEFKPDRFSPENTAKMHPFQFIPFSAGQRNCIGQNFAMNEIKVIVSRTIKRYQLTVKPGHVTRKQMGVVMRTENGALLQAQTRMDFH